MNYLKYKDQNTSVIEKKIILDRDPIIKGMDVQKTSPMPSFNPPPSSISLEPQPKEPEKAKQALKRKY